MVHEAPQIWRKDIVLERSLYHGRFPYPGNCKIPTTAIASVYQGLRMIQLHYFAYSFIRYNSPSYSGYILALQLTLCP